MEYHETVDTRKDGTFGAKVCGKVSGPLRGGSLRNSNRRDVAPGNLARGSCVVRPSCEKVVWCNNADFVLTSLRIIYNVWNLASFSICTYVASVLCGEERAGVSAWPSYY